MRSFYDRIKKRLTVEGLLAGLIKVTSFRFWFDLLSSRGFSILSMALVAGMLAMWVLPFQIYGIPFQVSANIAGGGWMLFLYALVVVNAVLCIIRDPKRFRKRIPVITDRVDPVPDEPGRMEVTVADDVDEPLAVIERSYRRRGYAVYGEGDSLFLVRNRYSEVGSLLFHLAMHALVLAVIFSHFFRFEGDIALTESQGFTGGADEYRSYSFSSKLYNVLPDIGFQLDSIAPRYWESNLLFTSLVSSITTMGDDKNFEKIELSSPMAFGLTFVQLKVFGFSPAFILKDNHGKEIEGGYVRLNIFPPGMKDSFQMLNGRYKVTAQLYPDYVSKGGVVSSRSMNYVNPLYRVVITEKDKPLFSGYLRPDEPCSVDGYTFLFGEMKNFGNFRVIRDLGYPFLALGVLMLIVGTCLKLLVPKSLLNIQYESKTRKVLFVSRGDYYPESLRRRATQTIRALVGER